MHILLVLHLIEKEVEKCFPHSSSIFSHVTKTRLNFECFGQHVKEGYSLLSIQNSAINVIVKGGTL